MIKLNKFNPFDAPNGSSIKYFAKSDFESKENFNLEIHKIQLKLKEAFLILCPNYVIFSSFRYLKKE